MIGRNLFLCGLIAAGLTAPALHASGELPDERVRQLNHMLAHDCGSCHGLTLRGGLGPALTSQALKDVPAEAVRHAIVNGRPGTPMPPFGGLLSQQDIDWLVHSLTKGIDRAD
jgi:cytochrome c55X